MHKDEHDNLLENLCHLFPIVFPPVAFLVHFLFGGWRLGLQDTLKMVRTEQA